MGGFVAASVATKSTCERVCSSRPQTLTAQRRAAEKYSPIARAFALRRLNIYSAFAVGLPQRPYGDPHDLLMEIPHRGTCVTVGNDDVQRAVIPEGVALRLAGFP